MTQGGIRAVLRLEGLIVLVGALVLYAETAHSWWTFAALLLVPDAALLGYLAGPRIGALAYNVLHSYVGPLALALVTRGEGIGFVLALVWIAHCGMDRAFGFGLKYASAFGHTHLGPIGRSSTASGTG
jgi:hypothetical protein